MTTPPPPDRPAPAASGVPAPRPLPHLRALRPEQWSKNLFVLAPLVFALGDRRLAEHPGSPELARTLLGFVAFCLVASAVYLLNDALDVESDRRHPRKRLRPIAAGEVSVPAALALAVGCAALGLVAGWRAAGGRSGVVLTLALYLGLNLAYSWRLKRVVLVDAFCVAAGFLMRVEVGGIAAGAPISQWLFLCTLFLSLFLALNKRRAELVLLGEDGALHRASLQQYSIGFVDQMVSVLAACTVVCYTMYTVGEDTAAKFGDNRLIASVPFVVFGIGRYMVLVQSGGGGDPTRVLLGGDLWFGVNALLWAATVAWALFG